MKTAGTVGKLAIRGVAYIGTNVAVIGGGLLGTILYGGKFDNKIYQGGITAIGIAGSMLAGAAVSNAVDKMLVEDFGLGVEGLDKD